MEGVYASQQPLIVVDGGVDTEGENASSEAPNLILHPSQIDCVLGEGGDATECSEISSNVLNYILLNSLAGNPGSTTTEEVLKKCFPNDWALSEKKRVFEQVMGEAKNAMHHLFGFDLVCESFLERAQVNKGKKRKSTEVSPGPSFLAKDRWYVFNRQDSDSEKMDSAEISSSSENIYKGALILILARIVINGAVISEERLKKDLEDFGVYSQGAEVEELQCPEFFEELIKRFCSLRYIKRRKIVDKKDDMGKIMYELVLGKRAYMEIGLPNIFNFLEQTCGLQLTKSEKQYLISGVRRIQADG